MSYWPFSKKESEKKHFLNNSLYCHYKYKMFVHRRKFATLFEDYLGLNMRHFLMKKARGFFYYNFWWFAQQIDAKNMITERNSDDLVETFYKFDKLRVDDILDIMPGHRAIHVATLFDDLYLIDYLIKNDAHLMARDWNGYTALLKAASLGRLEICKKLIEAGVPPQHRDPWGNTSLDKAKLFNQLDVIEYLTGLDENINKDKIEMWKKKEMKEKFSIGIWYMRQF